ncbi:MAG: Do family serine endopeptidase [Alphaproteobacteria bacterium]|nr:Do family serine endopeptidase [Alphaproteobacteria bacterium]
MTVLSASSTVVSRCFLVLVVFLGLVGSMPIPVGATTEVPRSQAQMRLSFAPLVRQTGPAVVNIFAKSEVTERRVSPLFNDPFFRQFFGEIFQGQPRRRSQKALGSGVILAPDGLIVTNHHVIANATQVKVVLSDRREFDAEVLLKDDRTDLAVLRIDTGDEKLPFVEMRDSDSVEVGDLVLAIGNPFGVGQTVTSGIVSALARTAVGISDYSFFIQTDASINPGNSGGALIAMDGKLIGVNTAIFSTQRGGGGGSVGIGFAVPSNMVKTVLRSARGGKLVRPWLGASGQSVTSDLAFEFGLDRPSGVIINDVYPGGPADKAGLRTGDVVISIGGKIVDDHEALRYRVATLPLGETTKAKVIRKGRRLDLDLALLEPLAKPEPDVSDLDGRHPFGGTRVANLSPAFAIENGFDEFARGVVLVGVRRGGIAERLRLASGDIVLKVNRRDIETVKDLKQAVRRASKSWKIAIRRDGKILRREIKG